MTISRTTATIAAPDVGAAVYRNLEMLEELGLVRHVHLGHGPGLYALTDRADREYLVCSRCHAFSIVSRDRLEKARAAILDATGFEAGFTHFPIVGLCPDCSKESGG